MEQKQYLIGDVIPNFRGLGPGKVVDKEGDHHFVTDRDGVLWCWVGEQQYIRVQQKASADGIDYE
ncbi:hypothetical protein OKA04_12365 [Luteolibacter flavescens]|uniref:Uncharacterized protein n=1 Tax=Luteolibacter flavescens TaxID=1859460 RepID=A0ABT3FPM4_9BACT|nr:hypothetical protein [Luteolibacter flavescens]MCW1885525.1 hypothetical protein [Luteolibacter flavescens]